MEFDTFAQQAWVLQGQTKEFPDNLTIPQYFSIALKNKLIPLESIAIIDGAKEHNFSQLDSISERISSRFRGQLKSSKNKNPDGDLVIGVCLQPSDKLISVLFGILKAGAAYVPFDTSFPEERIVKIVKDCRPVMVICEDEGKFEKVRSHTIVENVDKLFETSLNKELDENLEAKEESAVSEETCIILYTSGSSGEPKGVRLSHKTVFNRLNWQWEQFPFLSGEKCVFKTALTFVDSVAEIFGPLLKGLPLTVFSKAVTSQTQLFMEKLHYYKITRVVVVPSLLKAILQTSNLIGKEKGRKLLGTVKSWVCSGETLPIDLATEFFSNLEDGFTLCNFYGSTEVMGDVTFLKLSKMKDVERYSVDKKIPIGFPIHNTTIHLLNQSLEPVGAREMGEVFVSGENLAKGYVGIQNSDKFITLNGVKMYRTGDFGRIVKLPNAERVLTYEGRIDSQVKVRGYRVDLSEIEGVISRFTTISKVKVLCYRPGQPEQTILAYVVPQTSVDNPDEIKSGINESLREFERPVVRFLEEIPLLVNGKTDRQLLLKMFQEEIQKREKFQDWHLLGIADANQLEMAKVLCKVISKVTGTSIRGIVINFEESFFNLGGTSLNAVEVIVKLKEEGLFISIPDFTISGSIRAVLMKISEEHGKGQCETTNDYVISALTEDEKDEVIHIISYSFSQKGDLEAYVDVKYEEYEKLMSSIWEDILEKELSFIIRRDSAGPALAVSLNFDVYDEPNEAECSAGIKYVMEFLEFVESRQREKLPKGKGKLLHSFMMGTTENIEDSERVALIEFMEKENIALAGRKGFVGILTTNTNPLTMQIGRDIQGYEVLSECQVNEYVAPDGIKPFALAPDSFKIICCWKRL